MKYHSHLFGHEGPNSLLSYLKQEGLALDLSTNFEHELWCVTSFLIDITLTKKGLEQYEQVLEACLRYAQIVRDSGVQEYVFEEIKKMGQIDF